MDNPSQPASCVYEVTVDFFTGEHRYASDIWTVDARDAPEAERIALAAAEASSYVDPRIPHCWGHACARLLDAGEPP